MNFDEAFDLLILHEQGYSDNPLDPGGKTKYGVTEKVARRYGYRGDMKDLPLNTAKSIAKEEYWDPVKADSLPDSIRFDVFDTSYNSGQSQAIKLLQRSLSVVEDGIIGQKTISAVSSCNPYVLCLRFNAYRLLFLCDLNNFTTFGKGWTRRVAKNMLTASNIKG